MKKRILILLVFSVFLIPLPFLDFKGGSKGESGCAFCNKKVLDAQVFYRGEDGSLALLTYKPAVPGHVLIIPERHVERFEELTEAEIAALGKTIQKVHAAVSHLYGNSDYLLMQKNGKGAGQSVPHVHFHYLPRQESHLWFAIRFFVAPWLKPLGEDEMSSQLGKFLEGSGIKKL